MHVKSIKLINYDPTKYVRNEELLTVDELNVVDDQIVTMRNKLGYNDEQFLEELIGSSGKLVFTDELKQDATDLLKKYTDQLKEIDKYIETNLGNIKPEDDDNEVLYKMLEQVKHVTDNLSRLNSEEELFGKSIKQFAE